MKTDENTVLFPDERPTPKRGNQRGVWWVVKWGGAIFLALVITIVLLNFRVGPGKSSPLVRVSQQTTYATSPLKPNGDVDYIAFLNQQHAVTPENNAFVGLLGIMGPVVENQVQPPVFFELLGIAAPSRSGDYYAEFPFTLNSAGAPLTMIDGVALKSEDVYQLTALVPFGAGQFPDVDRWFEKHLHHFDGMQLAVRKPGYYMPYVGAMMYAVRFPYTQQMRGLARGLQRSSMARLGRGDVAGAIDDQIVMLRLGRHVGRQGAMVEHVVGLAVEGMGQAMIGQTVFSGKCSAADLARLAAELKSLPAMPEIGPLHLQTERVAALDALIHVGRNGPIPWNGDFYALTAGTIPPSATVGDSLVRSSIDWETVCRTLNGQFDKMEKSLEAKGVSRAVAVERFEAELKAIELEFGSPQKMIRSALGGRASRGRMAGNLLAAVKSFPTMRQIIASDRQVSAQHAVNQVAVALQGYKMEFGEYPGQLEQLVPAFLDSVPLDPYTAGPLVYRPGEGDPVTLYSIGPNFRDDGGVGMLEGTYPNIDFTAAPKVRTVKQWIEAKK